MKCIGCGVALQSAHPDRIGYIPPNTTTRVDLSCQRCFRIRHYGDPLPVPDQAHQYQQQLQAIAEQRALVVQVVDLFDLSGSFIAGIHRHIGANPLLIVANKIDLFPITLKQGRVKEWVRSAFREMGIEPIDVLLLSALQGDGLQRVMDAIELYRKQQNVYVVGTTNVGKSTFINQLLRASGEEEDPITTSPFPGTTLDLIAIPLDDRKTLFDTPGLIQKGRLSEWLTAKELKRVTPNKRMKPRVYQLDNGQTIFIDYFVRMDYVEGNRQSFVLYLSNSIQPHRTKTIRAAAYQADHIDHVRTHLPPWKRHTLTWTGNHKQDIVIPGFGWIACGKERGRIDLWLPEPITPHLRPSMI